MWTRFWDMNSGGRRKLAWAQIYIEAPEIEAKRIFYSRFRRNPDRVTCTCCGEDYSVESRESLEELTSFHRGVDQPTYHRVGGIGTKFVKGKPKVIPLEEYLLMDSVHVIYARDISFEERLAIVPEEGYVWVGDDN